jgi:hypothetical protein
MQEPTVMSSKSKPSLCVIKDIKLLLPDGKSKPCTFTLRTQGIDVELDVRIIFGAGALLIVTEQEIRRLTSALADLT